MEPVRSAQSWSKSMAFWASVFKALLYLGIRGLAQGQNILSLSTPFVSSFDDAQATRPDLNVFGTALYSMVGTHSTPNTSKCGI